MPRPLAARVLFSPLLAATAVLTLIGAITPARAFDLQRHSAITNQVLGRHGLTGAALKLVAYGALLPDVQDCIPSCYCDFAPRACQPDGSQIAQFGADHFDNNLLTESIDRVNLRMSEAQAGIVTAQGNSRASALALIAFGKALHTTQDFYAHSTYVEINLFPGPVITTNINNIAIWSGEPYALYSWHNANTSGSGDLQTGYYLAGAPAGGFLHERLNKDNSGSPEGSQIARISGVPPQTRLYGVASGDFTNSGSYSDLGLAPQHTIYAYNALLNQGLVFPYEPIAGASHARPAADPQHAQRVLDFFAWVNQDPTLIAMAEAADSIVAHSRADSIDGFPLNAIDADGLPKPLTAGVEPPRAGGAALLGNPQPSPFFGVTHVGFAAPRAGDVHITVYDLEGRHVATLVDGEVGPGLHETSWNGRAGSGARVPPGIYLVRYAGFGQAESRRVVLLK
jgi:hypothetical protein